MDVILKLLSLPLGPAVVILLIVAVYYLAQIKRVMKDYPPHRHVGDEIIYPKDLTPEHAERLGKKVGA